MSDCGGNQMCIYHAQRQGDAILFEYMNNGTHFQSLLKDIHSVSLRVSRTERCPVLAYLLTSAQLVSHSVKWLWDSN